MVEPDPYPSTKGDQPVVRGQEYSAIYEKHDELEADQNLDYARELASKILQLPPRQRARDEYDTFQNLKIEKSDHQVKRYVVARSWLDKWGRAIERMGQSTSRAEVDRDQ